MNAPVSASRIPLLGTGGPIRRTGTGEDCQARKFRSFALKPISVSVSSTVPVALTTVKVIRDETDATGFVLKTFSTASSAQVYSDRSNETLLWGKDEGPRGGGGSAR